MREKAFRIQLRRIEDYLGTHRPRGRGLLVLAGLHVWEMLPLQVNVTEELHWGKPSLQQMIWVLDEHRPRGAILIDGSGGRFFRFWLGTVTEDEAAAFFIDYSSWEKAPSGRTVYFRGTEAIWSTARSRQRPDDCPAQPFRSGAGRPL